MLIQKNSTTYEASGLPATVVIGGRDVAHLLPNLNASFQCGTGAERYWLNLNRIDASACSAIADDPTTNGIITEQGDCFSFDTQGRLKWDVVFDIHPGVYSWEWAVKHSPGVTFHHQPELTAEEIAEGHIRPADVVGSYAVYGDRSGRFIDRDGNVLADYGTGKLCHIHRPLFIDAAGREAYGTLDITDGIMTVGMDAAWMDSAVYPVRLDPTIGYEAAGASAIPMANLQHANWAYDETIADDITLQSGHIYCGSFSGGIGAFVVGLYSKGTTLAASALLASSGSIALGSASEFTWRSAPLSGSIVSGTPLVISCLETNVEGSVRSNYDTVSWGSGKSGTNATGGMFNTLSGLSDNSRQLSMYVSYEVGGAQEQAPVVDSLMPSPASGEYPLSVTFTPSLSGGTPTSQSLDPGDGSPDITSAPWTHTYASAGNYTATFTAANEIGSDSATAAVSVSYPNVGTLGTPSASDGTYADRVYVTVPAVENATEYQILRDGSIVRDWASGRTYSDATVTPDVTYAYTYKARNPDYTSSASAADNGYADSSIVPEQSNGIMRAVSASQTSAQTITLRSI